MRNCSGPIFHDRRLKIDRIRRRIRGYTAAGYWVRLISTALSVNRTMRRRAAEAKTTEGGRVGPRGGVLVARLLPQLWAAEFIPIFFGPSCPCRLRPHRPFSCGLPPTDPARHEKMQSALVSPSTAVSTGFGRLQQQPELLAGGNPDAAT